MAKARKSPTKVRKPKVATAVRATTRTNARDESALTKWVAAIAEGQTMRGAAVPLGYTHDKLRGWCTSDPEGWGMALAHAQATKVERLESVLRRIATSEPGDISEDPASARVRASTAQWLLSKWDRENYGDRQTTELTGKDGGPVQTQAEVVRYQLRVPVNPLVRAKLERDDDEGDG
jgi:hypothetical protein